MDSISERSSHGLNDVTSDAGDLVLVAIGPVFGAEPTAAPAAIAPHVAPPPSFLTALESHLMALPRWQLIALLAGASVLAGLTLTAVLGGKTALAAAATL